MRHYASLNVITRHYASISGWFGLVGDFLRVVCSVWLVCSCSRLNWTQHRCVLGLQGRLAKNALNMKRDCLALAAGFLACFEGPWFIAFCLGFFLFARKGTLIENLHKLCNYPRILGGYGSSVLRGLKQSIKKAKLPKSQKRASDRILASVGKVLFAQISGFSMPN